MANYVALFCKGSRGVENMIYGVCSPQTPAEWDCLVQFCKDHGIYSITGSIGTVGELIRSYSITYQLPGMPVDPKT